MHLHEPPSLVLHSIEVPLLRLNTENKHEHQEERHEACREAGSWWRWQEAEGAFARCCEEGTEGWRRRQVTFADIETNIPLHESVAGFRVSDARFARQMKPQEARQ